MSLLAFATVWFVHLLAAMSPGPSFVVCVRTAINEGFRTAFALSLGFGLGSMVWAAGAMAGLTLLFEILPGLFTAMKLIGAGFLLFVAFMMWRHASEPLPTAADVPPRSAWAALRFGFLTFVTNPKPAVFFGAVFAGLVPVTAPLEIRALLVLAVGLNETLWYIFVSRVFSSQHARRVYARIKTWTDRTFGALIAALGIKIALT
ncbi:LysE family translocator [Pseudoprimorskyibacter insulae]|uniref:Threonine efflux protein n=1 Tax=Pseudoprimorskyibacter insulae TaxID=1695997 RepID=A0A2R8AW67_9RHOB|nr:LysE family transporter [Pseudoprimorskyibacter insulae]SPF80124.1 Threonine efflux protein [Pseudoprimorskyibacter insulae]